MTFLRHSLTHRRGGTISAAPFTIFNSQVHLFNFRNADVLQALGCRFHGFFGRVFP